jgi:adhesin/invasin
VTAAYGDAPVAMSATATSGRTVERATHTPGVCSYAAGEVTILTAGLCTIRASQSGDPAWAPAPDVDRSFTVAQRAITVTALTDTKTADGTTDSDETPLITLGSLATGDTGTFSQAFDSAAVGTGKTLTPSGTVSNGVDVTSSYEITFVAVSTGVIGPGPADVTTSEVKATPPNVTANGVDTTTITVTLRDAFGNALIASGGTVALSADGGSIGTVTDNGNGTYTATYTSDTSPGDVTVSATLDGTPITDEAVIHQH